MSIPFYKKIAGRVILPLSCTLILIFILLFCSCRKKASFSGTVVDFFTGEPLAEVPVVLTEKRYNRNNSSLLSEFFRPPTLNRDAPWQVFTDESGRFSFDIKAHKKRTDYVVRTSYERSRDTIKTFEKNFYPFPHIQESPTLDEKGISGVQFTVAPAARVIIYLQRVTTDSLQWETGFLLNGDYFYINGHLGSVIKVFPVKATIALVPSNGKIVLKFTKLSAGIRTETIDTVTVKPFELVRHRFFY